MGRAVIGLQKWLADKENFFYGQLTLIQYFHQGKESLSPASLRRTATKVLLDTNILNIRPSAIQTAVLCGVCALSTPCQSLRPGSPRHFLPPPLIHLRRAACVVDTQTARLVAGARSVRRRYPK